MFPMFEVVPAIDVQDGETVQLVGGDPDRGTGYGDPTEAARQWLDEGARTLHLVDLDGAFSGERTNDEPLQRVLAAVGDEAAVQLGGGIRSVESAESLLDRGVDRVILGTLAVREPDAVGRIAADYPDGVMVSLDAKGGEVVVSGWTEGTGLDPAEAAVRYEELGAGSILFTNVDVEGQLEGVDPDPVRRLADAVDIPVVASGGVASLADVRTLRDAGAAAVVVGTALYEGRISLADAMDI
jgi:phosphoribosylformimino-5-aminoimidazole carboxamide ribotide isomerase